jgi:hypothetical protein
MPLGLSHGRPGGRTPCWTPEVAAVLRPSCAPRCGVVPRGPPAALAARRRRRPALARSGWGGPDLGPFGLDLGLEGRGLCAAPGTPGVRPVLSSSPGLPRFCCCAPWWRRSCPRRPCLGVVCRRPCRGAPPVAPRVGAPARRPCRRVCGVASAFAALRSSPSVLLLAPSGHGVASIWLVVVAVRLTWRCTASLWPPSASLALARVVCSVALLRRVLCVWWTATRPPARLATPTARAFLGLTTAFTLQAKASHLWCRCWRCPWVPFPC